MVDIDARLRSRAIFAELMTRFATSADHGRTLKALDLCTDDLEVGAAGASKPKGALANLLMARHVSTHTTRHHVGQPTIHEYAEDTIVGTAPITSYRVEDGRMQVSVSDFWARIVHVPDADEAWQISRLRMLPFSKIDGEVIE